MDINNLLTIAKNLENLPLYIEKLESAEAKLDRIEKFITDNFKERSELKIYSIKEAGDILKLSERTIGRLKKNKEIKFNVVGGKVFFTQKDILDFILAHKIK